MKITVNQLKKIIREEISRLSETADREFLRIVDLVNDGKKDSKEYKREAERLSMARFSMLGREDYVAEGPIVVAELVELGLDEKTAEEVVHDIMFPHG